VTNAFVDSSSTRVLPPEFDRRYPVIVKGEGVWVQDAAGKRYLDAMSGGSMALTLGHGRTDLIEAARTQAEQLAFVHNERLTNPAQERLATRLVELAPPGFERVHFVTGGAEANEAALRMARSYHCERGEPRRWRVISPAQAYHGPTMATLALTGRAGLQGHLTPYLEQQPHIPPSTWRFDPSGEEALQALDSALERVGPDTVSAFFCEAISAAALPAYTPPRHFWEGLAERREEHGFLICFDEVVTGVGRTGSWFAADTLPLTPDIIATAKGLGAGYAAIGATLCQKHVYEAFANGSRRFTLGHTWDGAPLPCAVGIAVLDALHRETLLERVATRGPHLRDELEQALKDIPMVKEVRGRGFLLGVEYVDPRDGRSFLPAHLRVAGRIDDRALERGLVILSTQPTGDGYAGDQSLFAPPFTSGDDELNEMVTRFAGVVKKIADEVDGELSPPRGASSPAAIPAGGPGREQLTALVVQHEQPTPGGYVHEWLEERGAGQDTYPIDIEERGVSAGDYDLIVSLGSEFAAFDDSIRRLEREKRLLREAADHDVPVLGICFGGQLLARVLGGRSFKGQRSEIGWLPVRSREPSLVAGGPWFQWHFDTFTPPPGARLIAESPAGPQAYLIGRSLGVQFHPEVTPEIMDAWVLAYRHELDAEGVDPDALLEQTHRLADDSRTAAWGLFDAFLEQVARIPESIRGR
jgi:adenosylmethionine-8-amino-7-oxononanoate aminotransferase/GMP synthase-like glutamine amidotransferase